MKIGIDYTPALKQGGGIGRYTRGLVSALQKLDADNEYLLLLTRDAPDEATGWGASNFRSKRLPFSERTFTGLWHRLGVPLPVEWLSGPLDIFHSPNFVLPPVQNARALLTVHDLSYMRYPRGAEPSLRRWLERVVPPSIARADRVLADSISTKNDLVELLGVPESKISVVGAGVEERFAPVTDERRLEEVRRRYRLPPCFILGLGTLEPRKNFDGLCRAYRIARERSSAARECDLVIAGGKGWLYNGIFEEVERGGVSSHIHFPGFVADDDLPALYTLARLFAYPSHYEGFGIPVLEAMGCGTPVICADNSSIPEVAGDAALMVDSGDDEGLARAIERLLEDDEPGAKLAAKGFEQVKGFGWEAAARKLLGVYSALRSP